MNVVYFELVEFDAYAYGVFLKFSFSSFLCLYCLMELACCLDGLHKTHHRHTEVALTTPTMDACTPLPAAANRGHLHVCVFLVSNSLYTKTRDIS